MRKEISTVFDERYDDVCLGEWSIGVCYATTFKIGEETVAVEC